MTSLAAAGVVVVVEADDFLKLTILSLLQTVLVPRTRDLSRPLQGSDKEHSKQCQGAKTGAKASKGFTGSTLKAFSYCCPRDGHVPQSTGSGRRVWCLDLN